MTARSPGLVVPARALALAVTLAAAATPAPGAGQDAFGSAVAVVGPDEVAVLKPGAARGPSQAHLFRWNAGRWTPGGSLLMAPGGFPGETLTSTLAVDSAGATVLLGAGDPGGRLAGHLHLRTGAGWSVDGRLPMDPDDGRVITPTPGALDMPTLMALMEPPPRSAVVTPDGQTLAVTGGALGNGRVRLLRRTDHGWAVETDLAPPPGASELRLGGALAADGDRVLVGAPDSGPVGGGVVWTRVEGGPGWSQGVLLRPAASGDGLRPWSPLLGATVALAGGDVFMGDPVTGRVLRFREDGGAGWTPAGMLEQLPTDPPGDGRPVRSGFGGALAASATHLAVGAPGAGGGRGEAHLFRRDAAGEWVLLARLAPEDLGPEDGFGSAVAVGHGRVVVGAPGAWGGQGRAAVFDLSDLQAPPTWLDAGEPLDAVAGASVPCAEGAAGAFACESVDLVSFLPLSAMGAAPGERVSDLWGWTDPESGREYVLAGRTAGMAVVEMTDPEDPVFIGLMPGNPSGARDIKVYRHHAFLTGDGAGDHGLLIFDLTRLRDVSPEDLPVTFEPDARYDQVASAHNLIIDTDSGFAYTVGSNTGGRSCGGGLHMIDIREPRSPAFAGCFTDSEGLIWTGRTHDAQCTVYHGPDEAYRGRQICFAANETAMRIVDVTDKTAPVPVGAMSHPGTAYIHQGWLTEDHRYLYVNDELDEIVGTTDRTRTLIWDVTELDDPILVAEYLGPDRATDHNLYIRGDRAYLANYQAGFRVLDISDPEAPVEIGWFDTTPYGDNPPGFNGGAWTAFPFFDSGLVVVSSMNEGLFVLRPRPIVP